MDQQMGFIAFLQPRFELLVHGLVERHAHRSSNLNGASSLLRGVLGRAPRSTTQLIFFLLKKRAHVPHLMHLIRVGLGLSRRERSIHDLQDLLPFGLLQRTRIRRYFRQYRVGFLLLLIEIVARRFEGVRKTNRVHRLARR